MNSPSSQPSVPRTEPDPQAWFRDEVHTHEPQLKAYIRGAFPSVQDADDVIQESYVRVWRRHLTQPVRSAKHFLFTVARHIAIDLLRHQKRSPITAIEDLSALNVVEDKPDAAEAACTADEIKSLLEAIDSLPPRCREVFVLRKLRGISQKEIAARMGISEGTVEIQSAKAMNLCEAFLLRRKHTKP